MVIAWARFTYFAPLRVSTGSLYRVATSMLGPFNTICVVPSFRFERSKAQKVPVGIRGVRVGLQGIGLADADRSIAQRLDRRIEFLEANHALRNGASWPLDCTSVCNAVPALKTASNFCWSTPPPQATSNTHSAARLRSSHLFHDTTTLLKRLLDLTGRMHRIGNLLRLVEDAIGASWECDCGRPNAR